MTFRQTVADARANIVHWLSGPWPFLPVPVFIMFTVATSLQNTALAIFVPEIGCNVFCVDTPFWVAPSFLTGAAPGTLPHMDIGLVNLNAVFVGLSAGVLTWLARRFLPASDSALAASLLYHAALIIIAIGNGITRLIVFPLLPGTATVQSVLAMVFRVYTVMVVLHVIIGVSLEAVSRARDEAQTALRQLRQQRQLVVEADERARREVAAFLHDQVQANLLVVAMQVRAASMNATGEAAGTLDDVIRELERIRTDDIRGAGRRLSPDLEAVGLDSALTDLAASWRTAMRVSVRFDERAHQLLHREGASLDVLTALYRTVEQALLNSAAHGQATEVAITIDAGVNSDIALRVVDNGKGLTGVVPGSGTALIDAWMATVHGNWSRYDLASTPRRDGDSASGEPVTSNAHTDRTGVALVARIPA